MPKDSSGKPAAKSFVEFLRSKYGSTQDAGWIDPAEMLIATNVITEDEALSLGAEFYGTKIIDLAKEPCRPELFTEEIFEFCASNSVAPWRTHDGQITYAVWRDPSHLVLKNFIYAKKDAVIATICCNYAVLMRAKAAKRDIKIGDFAVSAYDFSVINARRFLLAMVASLVAWPGIVCNYLYISLILTSSFALLLKFYVCFVCNTPVLEVKKSTNLPEYTILLPLYKEGAMIAQLINAIKSLDYPLWRLDIKIILEDDDQESMDAVKQMQLPRMFEVIVAPNFPPRTKAKACNYAMMLARGEYVTIFDAEDVPDADQLNKAANIFAYHPDIVCLQSRLEIYNKNTNLLTKMFALEYKIWHQVGLSGMCGAGLPTPLCGSSNHLRTAFLRSIGCWDAYNVTEDAELGMRIYAHNKRVHILSSKTLEEAPSSVSVWLKQRMRWIKGFVVTNAVYMQHPRMMLGRFGVLGYFCFVTLLLFAPFFSAITGLLFLIFSPFMHLEFLGQLCIFILCANILVHFIQIITLVDRRAILLFPVYILYVHFMHPIAAVMSCWKLLTKPLMWEKTTHTETM